MMDLVRQARELGGFSPEAELCSLMADEIERLRKEKQELELQYLSDQGQWIEETGRLRKALQNVSDMQTSEEDGVNKALLILSMSIARSALGEKE